jgi:MOSC domain-containing protein YiiM
MMNSSSYYFFCVVLCISISAGAFNVYSPRVASYISSASNNEYVSKEINHLQRPNTKLFSWLSDTLNNLGFDFMQEKRKFGSQLTDESSKKPKQGTVLRTATRTFDQSHSKPSSSLYTTKKDAQAQIIVSNEGVEGDYNHYRTTALSSTADRAISILTTDVLEQLKNAGYEKVQIGDLGENIYIDGVDYKFFEVGKRYQISDEKGGNSQKEYVGVIIEITERIEPCGNLCKLNFINDESIPPMERFEGCKKFLLWLDQKDGLRGWYAKVIEGGQVRLGNQVTQLALD